MVIVGLLSTVTNIQDLFLLYGLNLKEKQLESMKLFGTLLIKKMRNGMSMLIPLILLVMVKLPRAMAVQLQKLMQIVYIQHKMNLMEKVLKVKLNLKD